jgi:hypothetical protein
MNGKKVKKDSKCRKPIIKGTQLVSTAFERFFERFAFWKKKLLHQMKKTSR